MTRRFTADFVARHNARVEAGLPNSSPSSPIVKKNFLTAPASPDVGNRQYRILGVDTSLRCTGLAVIDVDGTRMKFVDCRPIPNSRNLSVAECLVNIANTLERYLDEFQPDEVAMEGIFFCRNARTSLILGHARGVVIATCAKRGLPISEYPPTRVKQAVTGTGTATKEQIQRMVQRIFALPDLPQEDSADAVAMAIAHAHSVRV